MLGKKKSKFGFIFKLLFIAVIVYFCTYGKCYVQKYVGNRILGVYYVFKGDRAYHKNKLAYSIQYYKKGLDYFPTHYTAWYNLGNIYVVYEDYFSAVEAYENAIKYNPKYAMARMNLGIIQAEKLGNFDEAIRQYDAIINLKNKKWAIPFLFSNKKSSKQNVGLAYYNRGLAYKGKAFYLPEEEKDMEYTYLRLATESYEKSHKILKKNSDVVYNLALTYQIMGNYRDAGLNYCKAIELTPMNYEAHYNLGILLRRLKRYKDSLNELQRASILLSLRDTDGSKSAYVYGILTDITALYSQYGATPLPLNYKQDPYIMDRLYNTDNQDVEPDKKKKKNKLLELFDKNNDTSDFITKNGKLIPTEEYSKTMFVNFKQCAGMDYFKHEEDDEYK